MALQVPGASTKLLGAAPLLHYHVEVKVLRESDNRVCEWGEIADDKFAAALFKCCVHLLFGIIVSEGWRKGWFMAQRQRGRRRELHMAGSK